VHVIETKVAPGSRDIEVTLIGARLPQSAIKAIEGRLASSGLDHARLLVHQVQPEDHKIDVGSLKADILADIVRNNQQALQERDAVIATLREQVARQQAWVEEAGAVRREFEAQYPQCGNVLVGGAVPHQASDASPVPVLSADCRRMPGTKEIKRIDEWLKVRTRSKDARVVFAVGRGKLFRSLDVPGSLPTMLAPSQVRR
jgi:hypothetical protein